MLRKRYQVFISSTFEDLRDERDSVIQQLIKGGFFPVGMEHFPPSDRKQLDYIEPRIADSDYFLLLVAGRYGSRDRQTGKSYVEMEYDCATKMEVPILALLHKDPKSLPSSKCENNEESSAKLSQFRARVESEHLVRHWERGDELPALIATILPDIVLSHPRPGWLHVSRRQGTNPIAAHEIEDLVESLSIAADLEHPIFRRALDSTFSRMLESSQRLANGELVTNAVEYDNLLRALYETADRSILSTSVPGYFDAWRTESGREVLAAQGRSIARARAENRSIRVVRIFILHKHRGKRLLSSKVQQVLREHCEAGIDVRYVWWEAVDTFFEDDEKDFTIIDEQILGVTRDFGAGNLRAAWSFGATDKVRRLQRLYERLVSSATKFDLLG